MGDAVTMAIERIKAAARKAEREAQTTTDDRRGHYCDGTAHGLKEAIRMLEEERAKEPIPPTPEDVAARLIGAGDGPTAIQMRALVTDAIRADRAGR